MQSVRLSTHTMATRFELVAFGVNESGIRAAGEEALREIERIAAQLSFFLSSSEISLINARAAIEPVRVDARLFRLIDECSRLSQATDGAFDITVGPLMRLLRSCADGTRSRNEGDLEAARAVTGIHHLILDSGEFTVRFDRPGVSIDLGGYGKGYAIERAIDLLVENGVTSALLHGGTSSIAAIGRQPTGKPWPVKLSAPFSLVSESPLILLDGDALSVSAIHGSSFEAGGKVYGHVLDPVTGDSVTSSLAAAVKGQSPSICEALSTALLVRGHEWFPTMAERFGGYSGFVASREFDSQKIRVYRSEA